MQLYLNDVCQLNTDLFFISHILIYMFFNIFILHENV